MARRRAGRKVPRPISSVIDTSKVVLTSHAIQRLRERSKKYLGWGVDDPESVAKELLFSSCEDLDFDPVHKVLRTIRHNFVYALYFIKDGWRFVITEDNDQFVVLTIERSGYPTAETA